MGSLIKLRRVKGDVFRQVNGDGSLGKHFAFARDAGGAVRMKFNNNVLIRTAR